MGSKNHAGIHTGRNDCNGRPRGTRRRTSLDRQPHTTAAARQEWYEQTTLAAALDRHFRARAEAETGDEGLDGLHPDETPQA